MDFDVALVLGDVALLASYLLVIISILKRKSCEGWSGRMQILTCLVFITRYWGNVSYTYFSTYHIITKLCWIIFSFIILYLIYFKYNKTFEKRCDTFWIESVLIAGLATAFIFCDDIYSTEEILWLFSRFIESLSILPQYYFIFNKGKKDIIVTYYVVLLIYYRLLYIGHWMNIYFTFSTVDPFVLYPGITQLVLYAIYFLFPKGKEASEETNTPTPYRNVPQYLTQESLLETPLLKRSATASSSIYVIGCESNYSTLNRSIQSFGSGTSNDEGRY